MRIRYTSFSGLRSSALLLWLLASLMQITFLQAQSIIHNGVSPTVTICEGGSTAEFRFSSFVNGSPPPQFCTEMPDITHVWYTSESGNETVAASIIDPLCDPSESWNTLFTTGVTVSSNTIYWVQPYVNGVPSGSRRQLTATFQQGTGISAGIGLNRVPTEPHCIGDMIMTASGGTVIRWYKNGAVISGETNQTYVPTESGAYKVEVAITPSQCGGNPMSPEVSVTIVPKTNVSLSITSNPSGSTICSGTTVTFQASTNVSGASYSWSTGETGQTIPRTITGSTTLSVTMTTTQSCVDVISKTVSISKDVYPTPSAIGFMTDNSYCPGTPGVELSVGGYPAANIGMYYILSKGGLEMSTQQATQANYVSFGTGWFEGTYSVKVAHPSCMNSKVTVDDNVSITVNQGPTASLLLNLPPSGQCVDDLIMTASGGNVLRWYRNDLIIPNVTSQQYTPTESGSYRVQVDLAEICNGNSMSPDVAVSVIQRTAPTLNVSTLLAETGAPSGLLVCKGTDVKFQATTNVTGASYSWSGGETGSFAIRTINSLTNLSVTMNTTQACVTTNSITVNISKDIYPVPAAQGFVPNQSYCSTETGAEIIVEGGNPTWLYRLFRDSELLSSAQVAQNLINFGTWPEGIYRVTLEDVNCPLNKVVVDDNVAVTINQVQIVSPAINVAAPSEVVLEGGLPVYKFCHDRQIRVELLGGSGSVEWPPIGTVDGSNSNVFYPNVDAGGSATFSAIVGVGNCMVVTQPASVTIARQADTPLSLNMTQIFQNCDQTNVALKEPPDVSLYWQSANDLSLKETNYIPSGNTNKIFLSLLSTQALYLRSRQGQCWSESILPLNLEVQQSPSISLNPIATNVCAGASGIVEATVGNGITFRWLNAENDVLSNEARFTTPPLWTNSTAYIEATSSIGCKTKQSVLFTVSAETQQPPAPVVIKINNTSYQLTLDNPPAGYSYYWQDSPSGINPMNSSNPRIVTEPGVYFVKAKNNNTGCWGDFSGAEVIDLQPHTKTIGPLNRIKVTTYLVDQNIDVNNPYHVMIESSYLDGIGRLAQKVNKQASPNLLDMVLPSEYDNLGREVRNYLPYESETVTGKLKMTPYSDQYQFYTGSNQQVARSSYPFSHRQIENSAVAKVESESAPGEDWAGMAGTINERSVKTESAVNIESEVLKWAYTYPTVTYPQGNISAKNESILVYYPAGELTKTITADENRNQVIQFSDKQDRVILKKVQASATEWAQTYYIYDDFGNLVVVLPPEAVKQFLAN